MKRIQLLILLIGSMAQAQMAVQRATGSSYSEYQRYLEISRNQSFVRAYLDLSKNMNLETSPIQKCLDSLFTGQRADNVCYEAVKNLNSQPLNDGSREVVLSFLKKLRKFPSKYQKTYIEFEKGFSITHPALANRLGSLSVQSKETFPFSKLEMKAWKRFVEKKLMLSESVLLINGEVVKNFNSWLPPEGVFQWALISNTHEPFIQVSSFSQFASESIKELRAFSNQTCEISQEREIKTFGLKNAQLYFSRKCILAKNLLAEKMPSEHLGDIPSNVKITPPSSKIHWLFPVLTAVGLGLASHLKDKSVSLTF